MGGGDLHSGKRPKYFCSFSYEGFPNHNPTLAWLELGPSQPQLVTFLYFQNVTFVVFPGMFQSTFVPVLAEREGSIYLNFNFYRIAYILKPKQAGTCISCKDHSLH